ncbi:MAG TPA: extracellular solute-binding protein [Candidatus Binatia bacterium]|jgi:iron(III) transport system substrate-binding protein|nr:extracellular solute-binding protein [Candidatus Binatia bacterium]
MPYALLSFSIIAMTAMISHARAASAPTKGESLEELHDKAKKEGGKLNLYASLSGNSIDVILPAFQKRFLGVTVDHTDATGDKLIARIVAEGRGGRVIADAFGAGLSYITQMTEQKLLQPLAIPETAAYPAHLKSEFWLATDTQFFIIGWNTNLVKKGEEPKGFEDLTNPKWKGALMGESRDFQLLLGLAKGKYKSDENAIDVIKRIALNQLEFHRGHSQLIEFLVAGQRPVCFTCYAHQFPPRMKKGAPIQPLLAEGVGEIGGSVGIVKGAPHPSTALLWARWVASEEGQRIFAQAGETPAHPNVDPVEKVRPAAAYMLGQDDVKEFPKYEKIWKEIFQIR